MKIQEHENTIERSQDLGEEQQFTIKSTEMAFEILSSGLYSNRIRAIIRELSCNAHDAHVMVGIGDVPIEVQLPTSFDPTFSITDHGPGLSHEQMVGYWTDSGNERVWVGGIYNTYFESTKQASDDFIGQFGLGSKSPFSYASAFNVESRQNGIARFYSCFKNDQRKPAITLLGHASTDKGNGMTITMSVKRDDIDKFKSEARMALMYFSPKPKITGPTYGYEPYTVVHTVKGSNWCVRSTEWGASMSGPYLIQGFVPYPIDIEQLIQNGLSPAAQLVAQTDIDLYVPIGKASSSASREHLHYDTHTVRNLIDAFKTATEEMRASFQTQIDLCANRYEAAITHDRLIHGGTDSLRKLYTTLHTSQKFTWQGVDVDDNIELDLSGVRNIAIYRYAKASKGKKMMLLGKWIPGEMTDVFEVNFQWNTKFIIDEKAGGSTERLRSHLMGLPKNENRNPQYFIIRPIAKGVSADQVTADVGTLTDQIGVTFAPISDIPAIKRPQYTRSSIGASVKRAKNHCLVWNGFRTRRKRWGRSEIVQKFTRATWSREEIDFTTGGLYIPIDGIEPKEHTYSFDTYLADAVNLKLSTKTFIVGFTDKDLIEAKKHGKWTSIFDHVNQTFKTNFKASIYASRSIFAKFRSEFGDKICVFLERAYPLRDQLPESELKNLVISLQAIRESAESYDQASIVRMVNFYLPLESTTISDDSLDVLWETAYAKYPMFQLLDWNACLTDMPTLIEYVNLVEQNWVQPVVEVVDDDVPF